MLQGEYKGLLAKYEVHKVEARITQKRKPDSSDCPDPCELPSKTLRGNRFQTTFISQQANIS